MTDKKNVTKAKKAPVKLDPKKTYTIIGLKGSKHLVEGNEYEVDGALAELLVEKKVAKLK